MRVIEIREREESRGEDRRENKRREEKRKWQSKKSQRGEDQTEQERRGHDRKREDTIIINVFRSYDLNCSRKCCIQVEIILSLRQICMEMT
jgi:hypothetical protein